MFHEEKSGEGEGGGEGEEARSSEKCMRGCVKVRDMK